MSEEGGNIEVNNPGCYPTVCVELSIDCFAVNTVLQVMVDAIRSALTQQVHINAAAT